MSRNQRGDVQQVRKFDPNVPCEEVNAFARTSSPHETLRTLHTRPDTDKIDHMDQQQKRPTDIRAEDKIRLVIGVLGNDDVDSGYEISMTTLHRHAGRVIEKLY